MDKFIKSNLSLNLSNVFLLQNLADALATFFCNKIIPIFQLHCHIYQLFIGATFDQILSVLLELFLQLQLSFTILCQLHKFPQNPFLKKP